MSRRRHPGPMFAALGGLFSIAVAIWRVGVQGGRIDALSVMLFLSGALLGVNAVLRWQRAAREVERVPQPARSLEPLLARVSAIHVLLVIAAVEVAVNRIAVPMLRPLKGSPPAWHTGLDYAGLFLFYFTGVLAALLIAQRCVQVFSERNPRDAVAHGFGALAALLASVPLVISAPAVLSLVLELAFAISVVALVISAVGRERDLGIQIGLSIIAVPLLIHAANVIGASLIWPQNTFDGPSVAIARAGVVALCLAALASRTASLHDPSRAR